MRGKRTRSKGDRKESPGSADPGAPSRERKLPCLRRWLTRLLVVILAPTLFLAIAEAGLRLFGYGYDTSYFIEGHEPGTYLSNPSFGQRFFGKEISRHPIPTVLCSRKPENTYRIFVFGGSAAQGVPNFAFSFARILEAMLNDRCAPTRFEVINTGMTAINSHVVLPIAKDCAGFNGDFFVVYLGNNEVVGPYGAGTVFKGFNPSIATIRASIWLRSTRVGQLLADTIRAVGGKDPAREKTWRGMEMFLDNQVSADDPRLRSVYAHFRANLEGICGAARDAGAKVILSTVATNLKDCPPFASLHRAGLSPTEKARWQKLYEEGAVLERAGDYARAIDYYLAAAKIDAQFARVHFDLGRCYLAQKQFDRARQHFIRARDLDTLRFRADTRINQVIREVGGNREAQGIYLVDAAGVAAAGPWAPSGIPGEEILYEHVHLNFTGNYVVAAALFDTVVRLLPQTARGGSDGNLPPPDVDRCVQLLMFTPADCCADILTMARLMSRPPFRKEQFARALEAHKKLDASLTPDVLARIIDKYAEAVRNRPDDMLMRYNFAKWLLELGKYPAGVRELRWLLQRYPYSFDWRHALGKALAAQGDFDGAVDQYETAASMRPADPKVRCGLARALYRSGQVRRAVKEYCSALDLSPDMQSAVTSLAWIYATHPDDQIRDGTRALMLAHRASRAGDKTAEVLDTLGAAYAENGQFEKAVNTAREAGALAEAVGKTDLAKQIGTRLRLYLANKPYRTSRTAHGRDARATP